MESTVRKVGDLVVVELKGDFRLAQEPFSAPPVDQWLEEGERKFLFDLSGVTHIDSAGTGELVAYCRKIRDAGGTTRMRGIDSLHFAARTVLAQILPFCSDEGNEKDKT